MNKDKYYKLSAYQKALEIYNLLRLLNTLVSNNEINIKEKIHYLILNTAKICKKIQELEKFDCYMQRVQKVSTIIRMGAYIFVRYNSLESLNFKEVDYFKITKQKFSEFIFLLNDWAANFDKSNCFVKCMELPNDNCYSRFKKDLDEVLDMDYDGDLPLEGCDFNIYIDVE